MAWNIKYPRKQRSQFPHEMKSKRQDRRHYLFSVVYSEKTGQGRKKVFSLLVLEKVMINTFYFCLM